MKSYYAAGDALPSPDTLPAGTYANSFGSFVGNSSGVWQSPEGMKLPSSGTVCLIGCSVTHMNQIGAGLYGDSRQCDFGWANWLAHYFGGFDIVKNRAVGGATSGSMGAMPSNNVIAQIPTALSDNTDWIWMDFGILNDVQQGASVSSSLAYVDQILSMLSSRNVIAINSTPLATGQAFATAERMAYITQVNSGIAERCKKYKNVILVDAYSQVADPATIYAKTGFLQSDDNIHYLQRTCRAIAAAGKAMVDGKVIIVDSKSPKSQADAYNATSNPKRVQVNPKLIGSGGTALSGITGPIPTGCALSKAGTSFTGTSAVDSANGGWTVAITEAGAANDQLFVTLAAASAGWAQPGDVLRGGFKLALTGAANLLSMQCQISATVDGVSKIITTCLEPDNTDGTHVQSTIDLSDMTITVRLPGGAIPAGSTVTGVKMLFVPKFSSASAAATMKFTDAWLEKA